MAAGGTEDPARHRKNHFEIGMPCVSFLDGSGFRFSQARGAHYGRYPLSQFSVSYTRCVNEKVGFRARYHAFNRSYKGPWTENSLGVLSAYRWFWSLSASAVYHACSFSYQHLTLQVSASGDIQYRHISEVVFHESTYKFPNCIPRVDGFNSDDLGIGATFSVNAILKNRLTMGMDMGYTYFGHISSQAVSAEKRIFYDFRPSRLVATVQLKLGVLF